MKKQLIILALALGGLSIAQAAVIVDQFPTISSELQSQIVAQQTTNTGNYAVRVANNPTSFSVAFQTFTWTGDDALNGIGVKWVANSNNLNNSSNYNFYLRVLKVDALTVNANVADTVAEYTFSLPLADYTSAANYIYFNLSDAPLDLTDGGTYAFEITDDAYHGAKRLTLATAQGGTSDYAGGYGFAAPGLTSSDVPSTITGTDINSYVFFLTAASPVPEPSQAGLMGLGLALLAGGRFFLRKRIAA